MENIVIQGDCLEEMKNIPDGSVDMILTDLPYGTTACHWDTIIPFEPMWIQFKRVIKKNGAIVLTASQPFTSKLVMSNLEMFKYEWIWVKNRVTGFAHSKNMPLKKHENVLVFSKSSMGHLSLLGNERMVYNPQGTSTNGVKAKTETRNSGYMQFRNKNGSENFEELTNLPKTILSFDIEKNYAHPTQKPVDLFRYLIRTYTNEGETVLDCCAGSGTTGVACIIEKRNYILIEQEQKYIDVIEKRLELEHSKLTLF